MDEKDAQRTTDDQAQSRAADDQPTDGRAVDPGAESAGAPDILQEKLREVGATDSELNRLRDEYEQTDYQERMLANQQARGYDPASVLAYLENARARWAGEQPDGTQAARDQNVAVDSGVQVATRPAPDATAEPQPAAQPQPLGRTTAPQESTPSAPAPTGPVPSGGQPPSELELRTMVPTGSEVTRQRVLDWVEEGGSDQRAVRAQAALYVEEHTSGEEPRKTLVTSLRKIVSGE